MAENTIEKMILIFDSFENHQQYFCCFLMKNILYIGTWIKKLNLFERFLKIVEELETRSWNINLFSLMIWGLWLIEMDKNK